MTKNQIIKRNIKLLFTIISMVLMIPLVISSSGDYYRTLYVFLIVKVVDLCFVDFSESYTFFNALDIVNRYISILACAIAFAALVPEFAKMIAIKQNMISYMLFGVVVFGILREGAELVMFEVKGLILRRNL